VAEISSGASLFLAGCVASCGGLLVVAGASKLYRAARQVPGDSAVRRVLGVTKRRWRRAEPAIGGVECAVGAVVCAGVYPALGGAAMTALGVAFCVLLGYARVKRVPGGCGCIEWRPAPRRAGEAVSWREIARGGLLAGAGVAGAVLRRGPAGAFGRPWFWAGVLAGGALLILLGQRALPRTPVCRRPLWFPARATLRALAGHGVFAAMAESAGPFGPVARHRRAGCHEEFWFTPLDGLAGDRAVVFQVRHAGPGGELAVQASVRDGRAAAGWPARTISAPGWGRSPHGSAVMTHPEESRVPEGGAMRSLTMAVVAARTAAGTVVAVAACGLVLAACGSTPAPGSAPAAPASPSGGSAPAASGAPSSAPAASPSGPASPSAAGGLAACATAQLTVALTNTGALGGQAGGYLKFTNDGSAACQLHGWPAVVAVTAAGTATPLRRARSTMYGAWQAPAPLPTITLAPGASAYAVVAAADQPAGSAASCPAPYVRLRVTPPGGSGHVVVPAWLPGARSYLPSCAAINGSATGEVSAITPLSSLPH
jgi:Protein of unknown function (DUF4232)